MTGAPASCYSCCSIPVEGNEARMKRMARERTTTRRRFVAAAGLLGFGALVRTRPAQAGYPDRPIKIVVANHPGGHSDIITRIMADGPPGVYATTILIGRSG